MAVYKLIIADDEKIIQEGLTHLVDWESLGFEIVETFGSGEQVIEYLDNMPVDVVLTDIMMLQISGIDVARYVKEKELNCKVVFITGHKDFELALQALKYDVKDYILKPSKMEEVKKVFEKIRKELDESYNNIEYQRKLRQQWDDMRPAMKEKFVSDLMMGVLNQQKSIFQRMKVLYPETNVEKSSCILAEMEIKEYETYIQGREYYSAEQFDEALYNFIDMFSEGAYLHILYKYKGKICLFAIMKKYCSEEKENQLLCRFYMEQLAEEFSEIFKTDVDVNVEKIFSNIYEVLNYREEIFKIDVHHESTGINFQEHKKLIFTSVLAGNIGSAQSIMKSILTSPIAGDIHSKSHFAVDVFSGISDLLQEKNPQLLKIIEPFIDYRLISNMESGMELTLYCDRLFDKMKTKEGLSTQFNNNSLVSQVKEYVAQHIYEDVMLETVANEIYISTTHLSRIFKKCTGETFLQYVTRKKMEKAVELLANPEMLVYEIGERLGYRTPRYFSKLFYNYSGYCPSQYRREVLKMKGISDEDSES